MMRSLALCVLSAAFVAGLGVWSSIPLQAANTEAYVVLYGAQAVPSDTPTRIASAGGTLVARYDEIGVVIARSSSLTFRSTLLGDRRIAGVSATTRFATRLNDDASLTIPAAASASRTSSHPAAIRFCSGRRPRRTAGSVNLARCAPYRYLPACP